MPEYDFRCKSCKQRFSLTYRTYAAYDAAIPSCTACGAESVSRVINRVSFAKADRDYSSLSANEMLSVLEGGDEKQVDKMFRQVGESAAPTQPTAIPKLATKREEESNDKGKSISAEDT